ncbi:MAG TPA: hypothetical protein VIC27_01015 [Ktedonobacterales bacterium]
MRRISSLDRMVQNFQHNWETNPQFRALWSGGLGLTIVVVMCACLGFAFTFASAAASAFTPKSSNPTSFNAPSGTARPGSADSNVVFPTQTVPPWGAQEIPAGVPIPPSLTPAPSPTALPTPTLVPTTTAGGGGGGGGGCTGCSVTVTSATFKDGQPGSVTVHTSSPYAQVNVFIKSWPGGIPSPTNQGSTDGSGNGTITTTPTPAGCNGNVSLWIVTNNSGSGSASATCGP